MKKDKIRKLAISAIELLEESDDYIKLTPEEQGAFICELLNLACHGNDSEESEFSSYMPNIVEGFNERHPEDFSLL